jgi:hypothetical protein
LGQEVNGGAEINTGEHRAEGEEEGVGQCAQNKLGHHVGAVSAAVLMLMSRNAAMSRLVLSSVDEAAGRSHS